VDEKHTSDDHQQTWLGKLRKAWAARWRRRAWIALIRASIVLGLVSSLYTIGSIAKGLLS